MFDILKKWMSPGVSIGVSPDSQVAVAQPLVVEISTEFVNPRDTKKKKDEEDFRRIRLENQSLKDNFNSLKQSQEKLKVSSDVLKEENNLLLSKLLSLQDEISDLMSENNSQLNEIGYLSKKNNELVKLSEERLGEAEVVRSEKMKTFEDLASVKSHQAELAKKYQSSLNENGLLLRQLHQIQEDLESLDTEHKRSSELVLDLRERWTRLEDRYPDLIDYEKAIIESVDTISNAASFSIRLTNCYIADRFFDTASFKVMLEEGAVAILLSKDDGQDKGLLINPALVNKSQEEYGKLFEMSYEEWLHLKLATSVLRDLIRVKWANINLNNFDPSFWSTFVLSLIKSVDQFPPILRCSGVSLKRELVHTDYEHLWLEIENIEFGSYKKKKLELRLAAALISANGQFSQYPKIEIPLVNGNTLPFDSWYPESRDDFGPKFELRFSLEKSLVDFSSLSKLSNVDRNLVCAICLQLPQIIDQLVARKIAVSRPIKVWRDFSSATSNLLLKKLQELKTQKLDEEAPNAKLKNEPSTLAPILENKVKTSRQKIRVEKIPKRANKQDS